MTFMFAAKITFIKYYFAMKLFHLLLLMKSYDLSDLKEVFVNCIMIDTYPVLHLNIPKKTGVVEIETKLAEAKKIFMQKYLLWKCS